MYCLKLCAVFASTWVVSCGEGACAAKKAGESPLDPLEFVAPSDGWSHVKMDGGGYFPCVIFHPTVANLRDARTDVSGVHR